MTNYEVVKKLIGPIRPSGRSEVDEDRLRNLTELMDLTDKMIQEIWELTEYKDSPENSIRKIGKKADEFIKMTVDNYKS